MTAQLENPRSATRAAGGPVAHNAAWTADARFFEYTKAADPEVPEVPYAELSPDLHRHGPTRVIPFDLSAKLRCPGPATSPNLLASFVRLNPGESLATRASATSQLFYVIRGRGRTECDQGATGWAEGDVLVLPPTAEVRHEAEPGSDAALYWVHDEPLMRYLGVRPSEARFRPTLFPRDLVMAELHSVANEPGAELRNRRGVLLANVATPQTLTITHTLWSLLNVLPKGVVQKPHRHNSVALDLCIAAAPGTYTMIGEELDADGNVKNGRRADWVPGGAFVTPPGLWHSHHNESGVDALVLPIQDAGLYTFMRTLDIRFS
jgi:gentisate 1,2-dioxygenase